MAKYNRLDFSGPRWMQGNIICCDSMTRIEKLIQCYNIKNGFDALDTLWTTMRVEQAETFDDKARILWDSYLNFLRRKHPEDFERDEYDDLFPIKNLVGVKEFSFEEATSTVFDLNRLDKKGSVWKVPYLIAYSKASGKADDRKDLNRALFTTASSIKGLFLHSHPKSNEHFYGKSTKRSYFYATLNASAKEDELKVKFPRPSNFLAAIPLEFLGINGDIVT